MPTLKTPAASDPKPAPVAQPGEPTTPDQPDASRASEPKKRRNWRAIWLIAYENKGTVKAACKAARVSKSRVYEVRKTDADFAAAWKEAEERVTELIEETAVEKAIAGDGRMVEFMLKARRPKKYRELARGEEQATEAIEQAVDEALELQGKEIERLTDRLADVAPGGEAQAPRDPESRSLAGTS